MFIDTTYMRMAHGPAGAVGVAKDYPILSYGQYVISCSLAGTSGPSNGTGDFNLLIS